MGKLRRFEKTRPSAEIELELHKLGFKASPIQREESDYIKFTHCESQEVVLVDFAFGRFIYGDGKDILCSESSTSYENDLRYNQLLDAFFCNEIFDQVSEGKALQEDSDD